MNAQQKPAMLLLRQVEYYENLATVSIRRLWSLRADGLARRSISGWVSTLRDAKRIRAYRGWRTFNP